jgi:hypothetical protein
VRSPRWISLGAAVAVACSGGNGSPPVTTAPLSPRPAPVDAGSPQPQLAVLHALPGIDIIESSNSAIHDHGGKPADISHVRINVRVYGGRHIIRVTSLALLDGRCGTTTWSTRTPLTPQGHKLTTWSGAVVFASRTDEIAVPLQPDRYSIAINFPAVPVYQACDRFAFAVTLSVDDTPVDLELPLDVTREEPLRD